MIKLPLNLLYLKYFCDSVRSGSISTGARLNHVSQSAVSQAIAKLELELNVTLISHQPNRFKVTEEGRRLFESAKTIFQAIQQCEDELSERKSATITFACTHSFAFHCLPKQLKEVQTTLPHIRLNVRLGQYFSIKEMLKKGVVDFGILIDNDNLTPFDCYQIHEGQYRLWASSKVKNCESLGFLLDNDERIETNLLKERYKTLYGKELPVFMEVSSWSVISRLVQEGLGIGLAPDYVAQENSKLKAVLSELNPCPYKLYAVFEKNNQPSRYAQEVIELFRRNLRHR